MGKNVLMVLEGEFPPDDRVFKEAQTLISEGFNVTIACYTFKDKPAYEVFENIQIFRRKIPTIIYKSSVAILRSNVYFNWWKKYLTEILQENTFDIIHIHDLPLAKVGAYFKKKYNYKLVVDLHENWPAYLTIATHTNTFFGKILSSTKQWRNYEKNILQKADYVITVVEEMKQRIAKLGIAKEKIVVVENTIIPEQYKDLDKSKNPDHFKLFFAGGINIERGLQYVIPALSLLTEKIPNIKLILVGRGSYISHLKQLISEYGVEKHVEFLGWKTLPEVLQLTAQANITLIPHIKWEQTDCSSPNKLFQCMLSEVPLVVSNCDSIDRIVNESKSGLSYTYDNLQEFADCIMKLHENPALSEEMGKNGKNAVLSKYNWATSTTAFKAMYQSLI